MSGRLALAPPRREHTTCTRCGKRACSDVKVGNRFLVLLQAGGDVESLLEGLHDESILLNLIFLELLRLSKIPHGPAGGKRSFVSTTSQGTLPEVLGLSLVSEGKGENSWRASTSMRRLWTTLMPSQVALRQKPHTLI